ncbi:MAG TPA: DUF5074 domain-containing protein [Flavipsychrobacter sp.]|nr:DUF5074 domain-containing protein [Flavipsychrobacter sp.]
MLFVCEGSLGNGNASLDLFDKDSSRFYENIFDAVNKQSLGDIFQSITLIDGRYFLCINNSDKIVVINKADYTLQGIINIPKPRYILPVNSQKAYVSTLFSNNVYVINPQTLQMLKSIAMPHKNPESMVLWENKAIICTWDTSASMIHYMDVQTDEITESVNVPGKAPQEALLDKQNKLWVLSGDVYRKVDARLTRLDPIDGKILKSYTFPAGTDVVKPRLNHAGDTIYFIQVQYDGSTANNGVYRMNVETGKLPDEAFVKAGTFQYFWAIGVEPGTGNIFIGDPKGFSQKGSVVVYAPDGTRLNEFKTGVGPSSFYFDY